MLNHSASLTMSTSVLKALSGKLDIKRHSLSILYLALCQQTEEKQVSHDQEMPGPLHKNICLQGFTNNKGGDQPAHPRSLISAFVNRLLESIISKLATSKFSNNQLARPCS